MPGQFRLFGEYYWTLKMYIYFFSLFNNEWTVSMCAGFFLWAWVCWPSPIPDSSPRSPSPAAEDLQAGHCHQTFALKKHRRYDKQPCITVYYEWVTDRHMWTLTHPPMRTLSPVSGKKKGICSICLKSETDMLMTHVYTNTVSYWHSCQKSPKRGLHCIVWFLIAINWASKQDSIFSILKTQPRLNDLENRVTENKASWQGVDSISFKINKQKLCHILLCIKAANDSLHFITRLTNYWNYYDAIRGPA